MENAECGMMNDECGTGHRILPVAMMAACALMAGCAGPEVDYGGPATQISQTRRAEIRAKGTPGQKVLDTGKAMIEKGEILPGGCWDYINAVYNRAGFPEAKRKKVFRTRKGGPYADVDLIRPGDWVYFVNHSYGNIEHSSIFVEWVNRGSRQAKMLSYAGEKRREPARYLAYDLSNVYGIIRPIF